MNRLTATDAAYIAGLIDGERLVLEQYVALTPRNGSYTPELAARRDRCVKTFLSANPRWTGEASDASDGATAPETPETIEASARGPASER